MAIVRWANENDVFLVHPGAGAAYLNGAATAATMKAMGLTPGTADLLVLEPGADGSHCLAVELLAYWDKSVAMSTTNAEVTLNTAASVPFSMLSLSAGRGRHRLAPFVSQNLVTGCVSRALTWQIILTLTQAMAQPIHAASHSASSASSCDGIRSVEAVSALE